jgi:HAD superfamily hydrolase (TIGR01459 family)
MNNYRIINSISDVSDNFDYFIIDLWGVLHDGTAPYPNALNTLKTLKDSGKKIILLSNAPRRSSKAKQVLDKLGFSEDMYNYLLTSGELTFRHVETEKPGDNYIYIGPDKDRDILNGLSLNEVAKAENADFAIATGFEGFGSVFDEKKQQLDDCLKNGLTLLCANPDRKVVKQTGETQICAGLMAEYYEKNGGKVIYFGKPYELAYQKCFELFNSDQKDRTCCIGDSLHTDIAGGNLAGISSIFCAGGIHKNDVLTDNELDTNLLEELFLKEKESPDYVIREFC